MPGLLNGLNGGGYCRGVPDQMPDLQHLVGGACGECRVPAGESAALKHFPAPATTAARKIATVYRQMAAEVGKAIVGQHEVIEQLIAIFARSHCLLEGVPRAGENLYHQKSFRGHEPSFRRVQFTPDLMPADITGTDVTSRTPRGVVSWCSCVARFSPSWYWRMRLTALPQRHRPLCWKPCRSTRSPSAARPTGWSNRSLFWLRKPVNKALSAAQAQKDRFMFHIKVNYPNRKEEAEIIRRTTGVHNDPIQSVINGDEIIQCQKIVRKVPVPIT